MKPVLVILARNPGEHPIRLVDVPLFFAGHTNQSRFVFRQKGARAQGPGGGE